MLRIFQNFSFEKAALEPREAAILEAAFAKPVSSETRFPLE
jgi:hypothetical protein